MKPPRIPQIQGRMSISILLEGQILPHLCPYLEAYLPFSKMSKKHKLSNIPPLTAILNAVPEHMKRYLLPRLVAKPIRKLFPLLLPIDAHSLTQARLVESQSLL